MHELDYRPLSPLLFFLQRRKAVRATGWSLIMCHEVSSRGHLIYHCMRSWWVIAGYNLSIELHEVDERKYSTTNELDEFFTTLADITNCCRKKPPYVNTTCAQFWFNHVHPNSLQHANGGVNEALASTTYVQKTPITCCYTSPCSVTCHYCFTHLNSPVIPVRPEPKHLQVAFNLRQTTDLICRVNAMWTPSCMPACISTNLRIPQIIVSGSTRNR